MGIGLLELVVIAVAALVLLGPERLPEVLRQLGRFYVQLRRTSNEFRGAFDHVVRQAEEEVRLTEIKRLTELAQQGSNLAKQAQDQIHQLTHDGTTGLPDLSKQPPVVSPPEGRKADALATWDHVDAKVEEKNTPPLTPSTPSDKV